MSQWTIRAENKARQAELEAYLLKKFKEGSHNDFGEFPDWLKDMSAPDDSDNWSPWKVFSDEARELVNLYNENL
jgi:hypothetical protein